MRTVEEKRTRVALLHRFREEAEPCLDPRCGVYVLLNGDWVVYIGQSYDMASRVRTHARGGEHYFDRVAMLDVATEDVKLLEWYLIGLFRPPGNTHVPTLPDLSGFDPEPSEPCVDPGPGALAPPPVYRIEAAARYLGMKDYELVRLVRKTEDPPEPDDRTQTPGWWRFTSLQLDAWLGRHPEHGP